MKRSVEVENLGKCFSDAHWVFRGVSFAVPEGTSLSILGPSGAGKSVLLRILSGLMQADEGQIRIDTEQLGMLFQKNALFDSLTVLENLLLPLREKKQLTGAPAQKKSMLLLEQVGLAASAHLSPSEISGGMQKRLGIARTLVLDPQTLLYDEPTAGLDPITSRKIAALILEMKKNQGSTLICVTNDVERALQLGDRVGFLSQGKFLDGGVPSEVRLTKNAALKQFITGKTESP